MRQEEGRELIDLPRRFAGRQTRQLHDSRSVEFGDALVAAALHRQ